MQGIDLFPKLIIFCTELPLKSVVHLRSRHQRVTLYLLCNNYWIWWGYQRQRCTL